MREGSDKLTGKLLIRVVWSLGFQNQFEFNLGSCSRAKYVFINGGRNEGLKFWWHDDRRAPEARGTSLASRAWGVAPPKLHSQARPSSWLALNWPPSASFLPRPPMQFSTASMSSIERSGDKVILRTKIFCAQVMLVNNFIMDLMFTDSVRKGSRPRRHATFGSCACLEKLKTRLFPSSHIEQKSRSQTFSRDRDSSLKGHVYPKRGNRSCF